MQEYRTRQTAIIADTVTAVMPFNSPQSGTLLKPEYAAKSIGSYVTDATEKLVYGEIGKGMATMGNVSGGIGSMFEGLEDEPYPLNEMPAQGEKNLTDQAVMDQSLDENDEMMLSTPDPVETAKDNKLLPILVITGAVFLWLMK